MHRERFPGIDGHDWARLDGPAGSQVVDRAIEAMADWMRSGNGANSHGSFAAAHATDAQHRRTREAVAELLGADPSAVVTGSSMTSLTMHLSAAVGRTLRPGDELVCTRLDHDANVAPWLIAAERAGATVRFAEPSDRATLALSAADVDAVLTERTRWVAVTAASNAVGTIPDLPGIIAAAHAVGARVFVDAVHHAPHRRISVAELGCDVLACSPYKWFGPHAGVLVARDPALLAELDPDKLRPSSDAVPERWELGTPAYESLAGVEAAARYLLEEVDFAAVRAHEDALLQQMLSGLGALGAVTLHGDAPDRTPTVMFSVAGHGPTAVAEHLASRRVAVWDGSYYAHELVGFLGLTDGAVRAGALHYNSAEDVDRLVAGVAELA